jgi:acyl-coenzyme A thioesterase PaaI-like protein
MTDAAKPHEESSTLPPLDESSLVFVSPDGRDDADGTRAAPRSLSSETTCYADENGRSIGVIEGTYETWLNVFASLYGGFPADGGPRDPSKHRSVIAGDGTCLQIGKGVDVILNGLVLEPRGSSAYDDVSALSIDGAALIQRCEIHGPTCKRTSSAITGGGSITLQNTIVRGGRSSSPRGLLSWGALVIEDSEIHGGEGRDTCAIESVHSTVVRRTKIHGGNGTSRSIAIEFDHDTYLDDCDLVTAVTAFREPLTPRVGATATLHGCTLDGVAASDALTRFEVAPDRLWITPDDTGRGTYEIKTGWQGLYWSGDTGPGSAWAGGYSGPFQSFASFLTQGPAWKIPGETQAQIDSFVRSLDRGTSLDGHLFGPGQPCFGCSPDHPFGFHLTFTREGDEIVTRFVPLERHQGPVGIMHGGLVSTLGDEVAAWAIIGILGKFGFTASFDAKLLRPVRIGIPVIGRSKISRESRRVVEVAVRLSQDGLDAFTGTFQFVLVDQSGAERLMGGPIPEAWKRFCR